MFYNFLRNQFNYFIFVILPSRYASIYFSIIKHNLKKETNLIEYITEAHVQQKLELERKRAELRPSSARKTKNEPGLAKARRYKRNANPIRRIFLYLAREIEIERGRERRKLRCVNDGR